VTFKGLHQEHDIAATAGSLPIVELSFGHGIGSDFRPKPRLMHA
jgi:hypothetical protein